MNSSFDFSRLGPPPGARVAVVGGCGGMGRPLVKALLDTDVAVTILDLPASLEQHPPPKGARSIGLDGSDPKAVARAFDDIVREWSAIDGMVNLAGFMKGWSPVADLPADVFDEVIAGNLRTHFLCARAALPLLKASGHGSLVSVASTMAMDVYPGYAHYGAAKAAIVALVKGMSRENAPDVRVNAIAPGLTDTAFLVGGTGRPKIFDQMDTDRYGKRVPMQRIARAEDMTGPILFLLGPNSSFINGETISVDGGMYQRG